MRNFYVVQLHDGTFLRFTGLDASWVAPQSCAWVFTNRRHAEASARVRNAKVVALGKDSLWRCNNCPGPVKVFFARDGEAMCGACGRPDVNWQASR